MSNLYFVETNDEYRGLYKVHYLEAKDKYTLKNIVKNVDLMEALPSHEFERYIKDLDITPIPKEDANDISDIIKKQVGNNYLCEMIEQY